jgi:hypothetical protein
VIARTSRRDRAIENHHARDREASGGFDARLGHVEVGRRARHDPVAAFTDKSVEVEGRLVLQPPVADPEAAQEYPRPTLFDAGDVRAAR